jgi:hypothetical protein
VLITWLRSRGVRLYYAYLDDILLVGNSHSSIESALKLTITTFSRAGYMINVKKSDLQPGQDLVFIRGRFCTDLGRLLLLDDQRMAIIACIHIFMQVGMLFPARSWLQLLGLLAATVPSVKLA